MSQTFPDWGFSDLITGNYSDIVSASIRVWREAGEGKLGIIFAFATIPIIVMAMVYVRTRKLMISAYWMVGTSIILHVFGLLDGKIAWVLYFIFGLIFALSVTGIIGRK